MNIRLMVAAKFFIIGCTLYGSEANNGEAPRMAVWQPQGSIYIKEGDILSPEFIENLARERLTESLRIGGEYKYLKAGSNIIATEDIKITRERENIHTIEALTKSSSLAVGVGVLFMAYWQRQRIYNAANYVAEKAMSACKQAAKFGGWIVSPLFGKDKPKANNP